MKLDSSWFEWELDASAGQYDSIIRAGQLPGPDSSIAGYTAGAEETDAWNQEGHGWRR